MENTSNKKRVTVRLISSNCKQRNNKMEQQFKDDVDDSSVSSSDKDDRSYEDGDTDEEEEELIECADTGVTGDEQEDEEAEEEEQDEGAGKDYDEDQGGGNEDAPEKDDFEYEEFEKSEPEFYIFNLTILCLSTMLSLETTTNSVLSETIVVQFRKYTKWQTRLRRFKKRRSLKKHSSL